jgi:hypothetical protein
MQLHKEDIDIEISDSTGSTVKTSAEGIRRAAEMAENGQISFEGEGFGPIRTNFDPEVAEKEKFRSRDKTIHKSTQMRNLAEKVIKEKNLDIGPASVACLLIYPNISKKRAARVKKADHLLQFFSGYDYTIEVSGDLWDMLDTDTQKMLLFHQLMQVAPEFKAKTQSWKFNLRRPDFADFYTINDKHGNEWYKTIQATVSSIYDLDPKNESEVKV